MRKYFVLWALSCLTAIAVSAQNVSDDDSSDTLRTIALGEVTVKSRQRIVKNDRKVMIPTAEQRRMAANGVGLLQKMHLPRITYNPMTGEIGMTGQGTLVMCINGVKVSDAEIAALQPADVIRIEYHDSPGARWGEADAVIDYITRHKESGGNISGDFFNAVGNGYAGFNDLSLRHGCGRSEWSLNIGNFGQTRNNWIREYDETRVTGSDVIQRREVGSPVKIGVNNISGVLNYGNMLPGKYFFNAQFGYSFTDVPYSELGDRRNTLYISGTDTPYYIYEHMTERSHSPSLDLYLQRTLGEGSQLILDVVGTYIKTDSKRTYRESANDVVTTDVFSDINGKKYSVIAEGVYEKKTGTYKFTGGLRHLQSYTNNAYAGTTMASVAMHQAESAVYAEFQQQSGRWSYIWNLTGARIWYGQNGRHKEKYTLQPSLRASFVPDDKMYFRYRIDLRTNTPSLSAMNDVEQEIDAGQVRRGNPDLEAFRTLCQTFSAGYACEWLTADLTVDYKYEHNPIMESVSYDNGLLIRTYENQKSFYALSTIATVTVRPWKDHLSVTFAPEITRYISHGNNYMHTYTMVKYLWDIDFTLGNWMLGYNTMLGKDNYMYGEQKTEEKAMHLITVGYKQPRWSLRVGVINPFLREYWMETCDWSVLNPSVSRAYTRRTEYFVAKFNFNINYGRHADRSRKQINNADTDAGIMHGIKK